MERTTLTFKDGGHKIVRLMVDPPEGIGPRSVALQLEPLRPWTVDNPCDPPIILYREQAEWLRDKLTEWLETGKVEAE